LKLFQTSKEPAKKRNRRISSGQKNTVYPNVFIATDLTLKAKSERKSRVLQNN
jgi:hypothetical protein